MATLILERVWINLMASGEAVGGWADPDRPETFEVTGRVDRFAGGAERAVRLRGVRRTKAVAMQRLSTAGKDTLDSWAGRHVQYRDLSGRWFGIYMSGSVQRNIDGTWDVSFTLTAVTTAEGVEA